MLNKPNLLILGHARHGKDTVAELLCERHGLSFISSSWFAADKVMMPYFTSIGEPYSDTNECFDDRANHRATWHQQIAKYNSPDKGKLCREILSEVDMYVGMRCNLEYAATQDLFDAVIWVDAFKRGLPAEPSDSFNIDRTVDMKIIDNSGSLEDLVAEVDRMMAEVMKVTGIQETKVA